MNNRFFEESVKIRYSDVDYNLCLKPSALLHFLQDLASDNAEFLKFGYSFVSANNLAWFLLKYHMEFYDYPSGIYDMKIKTEPRGYNKIFAFRDFEIYNDEQILAKIASTWSLVDLNEKGTVPVQKVLENNPNIKPFEKREDDLVYNKIKPLKRVDRENIFEIRFDDIDVNRHVNNANYIVWAFELLDFDFRKTKELKMLDILFKKEITYGNKILSCAEIEDNTTNHILKDAATGEDLCLICAKWQEK